MGSGHHNRIYLHSPADHDLLVFMSPVASPLIWISRPLEAGRRSAAALEAEGYRVLAAPVLEWRSCPLSAEDRARLGQAEAVLVTSRHALTGEAKAALPKRVVGVAVGEETGRTLREAGIEKVMVTGGDVQKLCAYVVAHLPLSQRLVYLRGRDVSAGLEVELAARGYNMESVVSYAMEAVQDLSSLCCEALKSREIGAALFYSQRSAQALAALVKEAGLEEGLAGCAAFSLSPAVDEALEGMAFAARHVVDFPCEGALFDRLRREKLS